MNKLLTALLVVFLSAPAPADVVIMDATTNNGSFETPVAPGDFTTADTLGGIPGWLHPGGDANFNFRRDAAYPIGPVSTDGDQSLNIVNLAGWVSDVLTNETLVQGETVSMSVDTGWDSWVNQNQPVGRTYHLYAVDPGNFANIFEIFNFTDFADYNGFGSDAGWSTSSGSGLVQNTWAGWYTQVVVASGGSANNLVDNFVITMTGGGGPSLLLGDADNSGTVTADDLIAVQQNFGNVGPNGDGTDFGDANDDGSVTADDLISVQQNFGNSLGPGSAAAVPEPATLILFSIGLCSAMERRRNS